MCEFVDVLVLVRASVDVYACAVDKEGLRSVRLLLTAGKSAARI